MSRSESGVRLIRFAGSCLAVEWEGRGSADLVEFLYRHVADGPGCEPAARYRLAGEANRWELHRDERLLYRGDSRSELARTLLGDSCRQLGEHSRGGLLFHAAALARGGSGLLLPGTSGAGKSTLAAWLAAAGFDYLSDEMAFIPAGGRVLQGLARPLNLKHPSREILGRTLAFDGPGVLAGADSDLVTPEHLASLPATDPPLSLVLFPVCEPGGRLDLQPLSEAQAGFLLMQHLANARNLTGHGLAEVAELARAVPAWRLACGRLDRASERIERILQQATIR